MLRLELYRVRPQRNSSKGISASVILISVQTFPFFMADDFRSFYLVQTVGFFSPTFAKLKKSLTKNHVSHV